jgi:hypothetical protein
MGMLAAVPGAAIVPWKPEAPLTLPEAVAMETVVKPKALSVALFTIEGDEAVEVSGGGYSRQPISFEKEPGEAIVWNSEDVSWEVEGTWPEIMGYGLVDEAHGGVILATGFFDNCRKWQGKYVGPGDTLTIMRQNLSISLNDPPLLPVDPLPLPEPAPEPIGPDRLFSGMRRFLKK